MRACLFAHTVGCVFCVPLGEQAGEEGWRKRRGSGLSVLWLPVLLRPDRDREEHGAHW